MLRFITGDILESGAEVLVNSVNTEGVMGRGIALAFKKAFPQNYREYVQACEEERIDIGKLFVTETGLLSPRYVINFPTKKHWRYPSRIEYIKAGLEDLKRWLSQHQVKSIALPPLGSGQGKLNWLLVKSVLIEGLQGFADSIDIIVFEPRIDGVQDATPRLAPTPRLTPARIMLLHLMNQYKRVGNEVNLLVAQKLSYFLQRFGEPLRLQFEKGWYGPYAHNLLPVLAKLNGTYVSYRTPSLKPETIIKLHLDRVRDFEFYYEKTLTPIQKNRTERVLKLIEGFESPFGLELLSTVDFILLNRHSVTVPDILSDIHHWTRRKKELIKPYHVEVAVRRIRNNLVAMN